MSSALFFGSNFTGMFFHVALASDPPDFPDFNSVVFAAVGRFLPAAFVSLGMYLYMCSKDSAEPQRPGGEDHTLARRLLAGCFEQHNLPSDPNTTINSA
jgi:drug/metabolite transporter (DMT)-like permease